MMTWGHLSGSSTTVTLIDDQTGRRAAIARPGCHPLGTSDLEPLDLPWIMFICSPATHQPPVWELYSPATGRWLLVSPSPGVLCGGDCLASISAAGRYWLQFQQVTCPNGDYHSCRAVNVFQNIQSGEVRRDPSNGSTMVDLDSRNLTRTVCTSLSGQGPGPPLLTFRGIFALLTVLSNNLLNEHIYLERCGSRLHRLVGSINPSGAATIGFDAHEVVWMARPGPFLTGLTLPGLERFMVRLPGHLLGTSCSSPADYADCIGGVGLTDERLYIVTAAYPPAVWAAPVPLPAAPRPK